MAQVRSRSVALREEILERHRELRDFYAEMDPTWADRESRLVAAIVAGEPISVPGWEAGLGPHRHDIVMVEADGSTRR